MKVQAKIHFERVTDVTVGRPRKAGEIFEVSEERAKVLLEHNLVSVLPEEKEEITEEKEKKPRKKVKK